MQLDLPDEAAVRAAFATIERNLATRGQAEAMDGVLVQEMVVGGIETYLGASDSSGFGMLLGFGTGGVNVELWKDVVFRVHPLTDMDARDMLAQIRGRPLLDGYRGAPPADKDALAEAILRLDRMVGAHPEIVEVDLNPLIARPPGQGVVALDARVRVGTRTRAPRRR